MKILVVGGGIGGLAAALFLERKGFHVTLVEQAPEFKHIGFGLTIYSNGRRLLEELGIDEEISKTGFEVPWMEMIDTNGHIIGQKFFAKDLVKFGKPPIAIERTALHGSLVKHIKDTKIKLGTTIKNIHSRKDSVEVELSDGSKGKFDLVVAADGVHSGIRNKFFGDDQSKYYGWSIRLFWIPLHVPVPKGAVCLSKEKVTLALYPLSAHRGFVALYEYNPNKVKNLALNVDSFLPYLLKHGWRKKHITALQREALKGHQYYDHMQQVSLGDWYKQRIVLLGDARHSVSPLTGMGAGMALEDAFVLADELAKVNNEMIDIALKNYSKRRNLHVKNIISLSNFVERFFFVKSKPTKVVIEVMAKFLEETFLMRKFEKILGQSL